MSSPYRWRRANLSFPPFSDLLGKNKNVLHYCIDKPSHRNQVVALYRICIMSGVVADKADVVRPIPDLLCEQVTFNELIYSLVEAAFYFRKSSAQSKVESFTEHSPGSILISLLREVVFRLKQGAGDVAGNFFGRFRNNYFRPYPNYFKSVNFNVVSLCDGLAIQGEEIRVGIGTRGDDQHRYREETGWTHAAGRCSGNILFTGARDDLNVCQSKGNVACPAVWAGCDENTHGVALRSWLSSSIQNTSYGPLITARSALSPQGVVA